MHSILMANALGALLYRNNNNETMAAVANGVKGERRAVASGYAAGHEANV